MVMFTRRRVATSVLLAVAVTLLIASNALWAYLYFTDEDRDSACLKEGAVALAIILGHAGAMLDELSKGGGKEYLDYAAMAADHAIIVAQALYYLERTEPWKHLFSAVGELHDAISEMYQGRVPSEEKLEQVYVVLRQLSSALKALDEKRIKELSKELIAVLKE